MPHTPGPWQAVGEEFDAIRVITNHPMPPQGHSYGDQTIVGSSDWTFVRHEDARLIAAAPDLLDFHRVNASLDVDAIRAEGRLAEVLRSIVADARTAIAKAEGTTNGGMDR